MSGGGAKSTGNPVAVIMVGRAISDPQSHLSDRRTWVGRVPVAAMIASPTVRQSRPVSGTRIRNRDMRSTRVATAQGPVPTNDGISLPAPRHRPTGHLGGALLQVAGFPDPRLRCRSGTTAPDTVPGAQADRSRASDDTGWAYTQV
ncbi:hypothetical protein [Aeromicrobium sp.]|uniref:hypothetical protein n=1 Tax=Aeromicrobium sp. TaxID=1871063 RepID=UPI0019C9C6DE|nr:hypothetical protein [Aeromicrobium sp.]MBC7631321.1 hypothetical protein [Aeromicrobium sp.]